MQPARLSDGYADVEPGRLAAVVTYLEMREKPSFPVRPRPYGVDIRRVIRPDLDWYRTLFRSIGGRWLWFSRLAMSDDELRGILCHPAVEVYCLAVESQDCGLLELDFRQGPDVELTFLGLLHAMTGKGLGGLLLETAIERVWAERPNRFWLHTCTLDHPSALGFYIGNGFKPYKRGIEIAKDPRLTGILTREAAPGVPIIEE